MKISQMTLQDVMERMGSEISELEAGLMLEWLRCIDVDDINEISDQRWFEAVARASKGAEGIRSLEQEFDISICAKS